MRDRFDRSERISGFIKTLSNNLAKQQGLIPVIGITLAIVGIIFLLINVFVDLKLLAFVGILLQGGGLVAALIGFLIMEPLGQ
jgi:hypothetical protein